MLKRIPKSDISIRPFKAYKEWSFSSGSTQIDVLEADDKSTNLSGQFPKNSIYGQLRAQFYNGNEDNPFLRTGNKSNRYVDTLLSAERFLSGSAKIISIPNVYVGEGIKKGSVILKDNLNELNEISYFDDSFGNIQDNRDSIRLGKIDIENKLINFSDLSNYIYSGSLLELDPNTFDIENNILSMSYNGDSYELTIVSMDIETSVVIVEDIPFLPQESQGIKMGNVFYNQGLIVLTRNSADLLKNDWELDYKSLIPDIQKDIIEELEKISNSITREIETIESDLKKIGNKDSEKQLKNLKKDCLALIYEIDERKKEIDSLSQ